MRYKTVYTQKTIRATSPQEYDRLMNELLEQALEAQIVDRLSDKEFCSIVRFRETVDIPETLEEEYRLKGYRDTCSMCREFMPSTDGRTKYVHCPHDQECRAWPDRGCCEYYWAMMKNGVPLTRKGGTYGSKEDEADSERDRCQEGLHEEMA